MEPLGIFAAQALLYSAFPFAFGFIRGTSRLLFYYVYIAIVLVVGGFFGSVYSLRIADGTTVSAGSTLYGALILSSLMLVISGRDVSVIRNVIKIVLVVNLFKVGLFALTVYALASPSALNRFQTSPDVFRVSMAVVLAGGLLIIAELLILILVLERMKVRIRRATTLSLLYVCCFVGVLCLDGVLFPLLASPGSADLATLIADGLRAKLALALAFSGPLLAFLLVFRRTLAEYRAVPLPLHWLFFAPKEDLVEEIERQQLALEEGAERYRRLVESTADAVIGCSVDGRVTSWNRSAAQLYGWAESEALGVPLQQLLSTDRADELRDLLTEGSAGRTVSDVETTVRCRDGDSVQVSLTVSPVLASGGEVVGTSLIGRDISERHRMQRALEHQGLHDALTHLPNRALLADRMEQAVAASSRHDQPLAVLFVDLDAFKDINDSEGHLFGDRVLVEVAERLSARVRPQDTVARFGGDEFVVLLSKTDERRALEVAELLLVAVREPVELDGLRLRLTASIGVAVAPAVPFEALLRSADAAVYDAKARGRDQVRSFVGELSRLAEERLSMSGELRDAIATDGLHLVYQPVVRLDSGQLLGVEALLRWDHPTRGPVPPGTFIPIAERTGLARVLDDWVLRHACREFAGLVTAGEVPARTYLAVNVTAANVIDPGFSTTVRDALAAAALSPESLVLEVTETGVMTDLDLGARMLTGLRESGIQLAIDDFGTGWSSLTYVKRLPATILKIDRSFVAGLEENDDDLAIAASVIALGRATGMIVVAEGVETHAQLMVLRQLGCAAGQGYLWHRGVRRDELTAALATVATVPLALGTSRRVEATAARVPQLEPEHGLERLWELQGEGQSAESIAALLNHEGFRTPEGEAWNGRTVAAVLGRAALAAASEETEQ